MVRVLASHKSIYFFSKLDLLFFQGNLFVIHFVNSYSRKFTSREEIERKQYFYKVIIGPSHLKVRKTSLFMFINMKSPKIMHSK